MANEKEQNYTRHWSERACNASQLAQIACFERQLIDYAMTAWRPLGGKLAIAPPENTILICACAEGLVLMQINHMGDWRTSLGQPHKPPQAWMPAPILPKSNEGGGL